MKIWFSNSIPYGWLLCNGQSCASYSNLATFLGKNTVPDLRGEFLRGAGTNSHSDQGNGGTVGQHQNGTLIPYTWTYFAENSASLIGVVNHSKNGAWLTDSDKSNMDAGSLKYDIGGSSYTVDEAYPVSYTTRPTNTSVNYIIKW